MNDDFLAAMRQLEQFATAKTRQDHYRGLRETEKSDVMDNFFDIMAREDPTLDKVTGSSHTVESMVNDLRSRVGLDQLLSKRASDAQPVLSRKAKYMVDDGANLSEQDLIEKLESFSQRHFLERDHGMSSVETIIEDFKSQPGGMKAIEAFGRDKIREILRGIVARFPKDDTSAMVPNASAYTMPSADRNPQLGERANIGMGGASGTASR